MSEVNSNTCVITSDDVQSVTGSFGGLSTAEPVVSVGGLSTAEPVVSVGGLSTAEPVVSECLPESVGSTISVFPTVDHAMIRENAQKIKAMTGLFTRNPLFQKDGDMCMSGLNLRREHTLYLGWSVFEKEATQCMLRHVGKTPVLSLAAGNASQETCLAAGGATVVCTDMKPPRNPWMPVECLANDEAVQKWRPHCPVAMIVWPEYTDRADHKNHEPLPDCDTYNALLKGNFVKVIYIGEKDGCTGSPQLDSFLRKNYRKIEEHYIPCWPGIHDSLRVYERKTDKVVAVPKPKNSWETWEE
jgi:hypothetical protein